MRIAKIIFSDTDLTNKQVMGSMTTLLEKGASNLINELAAIGTCDFGHAVITKSYTSDFTNYIFIPILDQQSPEYRIDTPTFHQSIRSALDLAKLYEIGDIVLEIPNMNQEKTVYSLKSWGLSLRKVIRPLLNRERIKDVVNSVSRDYPGILVRFVELS